MGVAEAIQLAFVIGPKLPGLISDFKALFAAHPALADPAAQMALIMAVAQAAGNVDDAAVAKWAADQAAHQ